MLLHYFYLELGEEDEEEDEEETSTLGVLWVQFVSRPLKKTLSFNIPKWNIIILYINFGFSNINV